MIQSAQIQTQINNVYYHRHSPSPSLITPSLLNPCTIFLANRLIHCCQKRSLVIRILQTVLLHIHQIYLFAQFHITHCVLLEHRATPLLFRYSVPQFIVELVMKILTQTYVLGSHLSQSKVRRFTLGRMEPEMFGSLNQRYPLFFVFQELAHEAPGEGRVFFPDLIVESHFTSQYIHDRFGMILRFKRRIPSYHLKNSDPKCPNIDLLVIAPSIIDLRRQIEMRANNGQHVPSTAPGKSPLGDIEIYNFDFPRLLIIEDVLRFDISVAEITIMYIGYRRDDFFSYHLQLPLLLDFVGCQGREGQVLHHQEGESFILVEVQRLVATDRWVVELFETYEVFLELGDMLLLDSYLLGCVEAVVGLETALEHTSVGPLPQFFQKLVVLKKSVIVVSLCGVLGNPCKIRLAFGSVIIG